MNHYLHENQLSQIDNPTELCVNINRLYCRHDQLTYFLANFKAKPEKIALRGSWLTEVFEPSL